MPSAYQGRQGWICRTLTRGEVLKTAFSLVGHDPVTPRLDDYEQTHCLPLRRNAQTRPGTRDRQNDDKEGGGGTTSVPEPSEDPFKECDLLARSQEVAKSATKLPRNPLVYHDILLDFAMV